MTTADADPRNLFTRQWVWVAKKLKSQCARYTALCSMHATPQFVTAASEDIQCGLGRKLLQSRDTVLEPRFMSDTLAGLHWVFVNATVQLAEPAAPFSQFVFAAHLFATKGAKSFHKYSRTLILQKCEFESLSRVEENTDKTGFGGDRPPMPMLAIMPTQIIHPDLPGISPDRMLLTFHQRFSEFY